MKTYAKIPKSQWSGLCQRPALESEDLATVVSSVFNRVQSEGDRALLDYTEQFDSVQLQALVVTANEFSIWTKQVPAELKQAIDTAYGNIATFHKAQQASLSTVTAETQSGVRCWRESRPIERVGLYIPGGTAPLFSTVLMLGVPAQLAGCSEVILCTPPQADGSVNPAICYAAQLVGITKIIKVGGAQAIAALSCGTQSVPKVDKIFGPGNQYVTAAKLYAQRYGVAMDMPAGPSEVMVLADSTAKPEFIAADLLSQAEHGSDSQVVLVATSNEIAESVSAEINQQLTDLPRREIAEAALVNSFCVVMEDSEEAIAFANQYAPEHLILSVTNPEVVTKQIKNAGSVFLGNYTPESAGDYASGTNHTLPTNGWARSYSGLSLESFCKYVTFQSITEAGAKVLAPTVMAMAEAEGLTAHKRAMELRQ
jgi:histidinol dehydrogenase